MFRNLARIKAFYRTDPISSFILTAGAVDLLIGGVSSHWGLALLGMGMIGVAIALFKRLRRSVRLAPTSAPVRSLPIRASRPQLPPLVPSEDVAR